MSIKIEVKVPADIGQLMKHWFVTLEPPYWYLRCRGCDWRYHVPWDARLRTQDTHEMLREHGRKCAAARNARDVEAAELALRRSVP